MKRSELYVGVVVYHTVFPHWGRGVVTEVRYNDNLGLPTAYKFFVVWDGVDREGWRRASELRKTPSYRTKLCKGPEVLGER
jgi:hypothetical protein